MRYYSILMLMLMMWSVACQSQYRKAIIPTTQPMIPLDSVVQDMNSVNQYLSTNLLPDLASGKYVVYDTANQLLSEPLFLERYGSGEYFPLKMKVDIDTLSVYRLVSMRNVKNEQVVQFFQFMGKQFLTLDLASDRRQSIA